MNLEQEIVKYIEENFSFGKADSAPNHPKQGLSSKVFFLKFPETEIVVKYGDSVDKDLQAINILKENNSAVPVPEIYGFFTIGDIHILLLEKINGKLFGEIELADLSKYYQTVISTLSELHKIKKDKIDWRKYLLNIFDGNMINWETVLLRKNLDAELIQKSMVKIIDEISKLDFQSDYYSLLHTDFNQGNLFIDEKLLKIIGVIDWEEATFGDPVYDFARFHLHLWHRGVSKSEIENFLSLLNLSTVEKEKENIYFISYIVHYLAYYSENNDSLSLDRRFTHQDFLKKWLDR